MTPEQKLNHLKDYMEYFIDFKIMNWNYFQKMMNLYFETGLLIHSFDKNDLINFEKYLQLIDNQK